MSGEYHIYQLIPLHSCDYLQKIFIKINLETEEQAEMKYHIEQAIKLE